MKTFSIVHTSIKIAHTKMYKTKKLINRFLRSSWVPNLAKCMRVVCECKNIKETMQRMS